MKRLLALLLTVSLIMGLSACGNDNSPQQTTENTTLPQQTEITEDTTPVTQATEASNQPLTSGDVVHYLMEYAISNDLGADCISTPEKKAGETANQTVTNFTFLDNLVTVSVYETDGVVQAVNASALPPAFYERGIYDSLVDAAFDGGYVACMIPLFACEPEIDSIWHAEQLSAAPDEGDSSTFTRNYHSNEWNYYISMNEIFVSCTAARYCSRCGKSAPDTLFTTGNSICDICEIRYYSNPQLGISSNESGTMTD